MDFQAYQCASIDSLNRPLYYYNLDSDTDSSYLDTLPLTSLLEGLSHFFTPMPQPGALHYGEPIPLNQTSTYERPSTFYNSERDIMTPPVSPSSWSESSSWSSRTPSPPPSSFQSFMETEAQPPQCIDPKLLEAFAVMQDMFPRSTSSTAPATTFPESSECTATVPAIPPTPPASPLPSMINPPRRSRAGTPSGSSSSEDEQCGPARTRRRTRKAVPYSRPGSDIGSSSDEGDSSTNRVGLKSTGRQWSENPPKMPKGRWDHCATYPIDVPKVRLEDIPEFYLRRCARKELNVEIWDGTHLQALGTSQGHVAATEKRCKKKANYLCKCCGHRFTTAYALPGHITAHLGNKPWGCCCSQRFARRDDLDRHFKIAIRRQQTNHGVDLSDDHDATLEWIHRAVSELCVKIV